MLTPDEILQAQQEGRAMAVRACSTCRHQIKSANGPGTNKCGAIGGGYTSIERRYVHGPCGMAGKMWEPRPPHHPGIIEKVWRWLVGWQP